MPVSKLYTCLSGRFQSLELLVKGRLFDLKRDLGTRFKVSLQSALREFAEHQYSPTYPCAKCNSPSPSFATDPRNPFDNMCRKRSYTASISPRIVRQRTPSSELGSALGLKPDIVKLLYSNKWLAQTVQALHFLADST